MSKENKLQESTGQTLTTPVVRGSCINTEIYNTLSNLSNSIGETITEYHWRESCRLMKMMEDENMVKITWR